MYYKLTHLWTRLNENKKGLLKLSSFIHFLSKNHYNFFYTYCSFYCARDYVQIESCLYIKVCAFQTLLRFVRFLLFIKFPFYLVIFNPTWLLRLLLDLFETYESNNYTSYFIIIYFYSKNNSKFPKRAFVDLLSLLFCIFIFTSELYIPYSYLRLSWPTRLMSFFYPCFQLS